MKMKKLLTLFLAVALVIAGALYISGKDSSVYAADDTEAVVKEVLKVNCQVTAGTTSESTSTNLRLVSTVDSLNYKSVGFEIVYEGTTINHSTTTVYERIIAKTDSDSYNYNPKVVDAESEYFVTATLVNIAQKNFDKVFTIRPYVITTSDETVYGVTKMVKVSDSYNGLINIPAQAETEDVANALTLNYNGASATPDAIRYDAQSKYANLLINGSSLPSATKITVLNGETEVANVLHRNAVGEYTGTADKTWYTACESTETKYVILTEADLYGFSELSQTYDFSGKTIYLGADIELYSGNAADWATNAPGTQWNPIGRGTWFAGTFDGNNSTISGVFINTSNNYVGLFGKATGTIKNISLKNSYICSSGHDYPQAASIVGLSNGTVEGCYSNAIVVANGNYVAGIVARTEGTLNVKKCWFDGQLTSSGRFFGGIVGTTASGTVNIDNCLNTGSITSTTTNNYPHVGGIIGCTETATAVCNISNCLSVGKISVTGFTLGNANTVGAVIGRYKEGGSKGTITNAYWTTSALAIPISTNSGGVITGTSTNIVSSHFTQKTEAQLMGVAAKNNTALDFENIWVAKGCGRPELKQFSSEDIIISGNTDWYEEASAKKTYTINTKEELYGLAELAQTNSFEGWNIKLGCDITINANDKEEWARIAPKYAWHPIGRETAFAGTFDGQGHTISGIYLKTSSNQIGLFGKTNANAVIKNLSIKNSYFESTAHANPQIGSVIGEGNGTVDTVYSEAMVVSNGTYTGGMVGRVSSVLTVNNCWFAGNVTSSARYVGGLVGASEGTKLTVQNCLNTGTIVSSYTNTASWPGAGGFVGAAMAGQFVFSDCLNLGTVKVAHIAGVGTLVGRTRIPTTVTNAYTVNNITCSAGTIGKQDTLSAGFGNYCTNSNTVTGDASAVTVAQLTGLKAANATKLDFGEAWTTSDYATPMLRCFADIAICGTDGSWYEENVDTKTYTITTAEELYGLAQLSHLYDFSGWTIKLGADITINTGNAADWAAKAPAYYWESIGRTNWFKGTFDGQGHSISGLYLDANVNTVGLFGKVNGTIRNVSLKNSFLRSTVHTHPQVGSVVGLGIGTIENVYSNAIMDVHGNYAGGIVARTEGTLAVRNCWYDGTLTSSERFFGGIMGTTANGEVTFDSCLNTGTIISTITTNIYPHVAGIIGGVETSGSVCNITNCVGFGKIDVRGFTVGNGSTAGAIVGRYAEGSSGTVSNNYYTTAALGLPISTNSGGTLTGTSTKIVPAHFKLKTVAQLTGAQARYNTTFDFYTGSADDGAWVAREGKTLALKIFVPNTEWYVEDEVIVADTSWYDSNTSATTFTISTTAEMVGLSNKSKSVNFNGKTINLEGDICFNLGSAKDWATTAPVNEFGMIGGSSANFCGTFNGNGHTISGVYIDVTTNLIGLFQVTAAVSTIKNFSMVNSYICSTVNGYPQVGSIVGSGAGTLTDIYTDTIVSVSGNYAGGIWGRTTGVLNISNCWFDGSIITAGQYIGGILGVVESNGSATITNCLTTGEITNTVTGKYPHVGGICGGTNGGTTTSATISKCLVTGSITCANAGGFGSLFGSAQAGTVTITDSYSTEECCTLSITGYKASGATINTTGVVCLPEEYVIGASAASWTTLDFDTIWAARDGKFPGLQAFVPEDEQMDLTGVIKADTSWVTATAGSEADPYLIVDAGDLHGLSLLSYGQNFSGKTIVVTEDITVNTGVLTGTTPSVAWLPIGQKVAFAGTFGGASGAVKSISGLYLKTDRTYVRGGETAVAKMGLFGETAHGSKIQNISLKDSYFESTKDVGYGANAYLGSIVGYSYSNLENVYSNATVIGHGRDIGGLIGRVNNAQLLTPASGETKTTSHMATTTLANCWFDGNVISDKQYVGGIAGELTQGSLVMTNCLFTGTLTSTFADVTVGTTSYIQTRAGGFVGYIQNTWTKITIEDSISTGTIIDSNKRYGVGSVIGRIATTIEGATLTDVYALAGQSVGSSEIEVTGLVTEVQADDRLIAYNDYLNGGGLDFDNVWTLRTTGVPALKMFVPAEEVYTYTDSTLALSYWADADASFQYAEDKGVSNYVMTVSDSGNKYASYETSLVNAGFSKVVDNQADATALASKGVYNAVYTKEDGGVNWVLNLTHAGNSKNETYISVNTGKTAAEAISAHMYQNNNISYTAQDGYTASTEQEVKLVMRELWHFGNSLIIQLSNGHFIISDGGGNHEMKYLIDDLCAMTDGKKPIIEAWTISHLHYDHSYIMSAFLSNPEYADKIYVEGIYLNEPGYASRAVEGDDGKGITDCVKLEREGVKLFKTTKEASTPIYRYQTGQRFYFDSVTMDVVQAQEQIPLAAYDGTSEYPSVHGQFNSTSTGLMFTMEDGTTNGKKVYIGGDQTKANMDWIMASYNASLFTDVNVFTAFHHGQNTLESFTAWTTNNYAHQFDVVLVPNGAANIPNQSTSLKTASKQQFTTYGGNVTLTFTDGGITTDVAGNRTWTYHEGQERP